MFRGLMGDDEWAFFEPFLTCKEPKSGRPPSNHHLVLDGIFWLARTGARPSGAWLRQNGLTFRTILAMVEHVSAVPALGAYRATGHFVDALIDTEAVPDSLQMIDSTVVRAHHHASGSKRGTQSLSLAPHGEQGLGRSKGGFTTKIHLRINAAGLPVAAVITSGEVSDFRGYAPVMADGPQPKVLIADKGGACPRA